MLVTHVYAVVILWLRLNGVKQRLVGLGAAKSTLKRVDYGLRPAHSTCGEWLENPSQNNPEKTLPSRSATR